MRWPYRDKRVEWSEEKNAELLRLRGVSFQDVMLAIDEEKVLEILPHWSRKYPHQHVIVVDMQGYIYAVPCIIEGERIFLKTLYPSREMKERFNNK